MVFISEWLVTTRYIIVKYISIDSLNDCTKH